MGTPGFRFLLGGIATLLAAVGLFGVGVRTAQADPHAVFYTAVGQQQLFFNVLAALDQADYVEHKSLPGLPPDNKLTREGLLERRQQAGFGPEADPVITETGTDLASILTRNITLEGNDLWTAYLAQQFAIEAARRNGADEVIRIFCERGLGREFCNDDIQNIGDTEASQKSAFNVDPAERGLASWLDGVLGILSSNEKEGSYDQAQRVEAREEKRPRPWDSALAAFRGRAENDAAKNQAIERIGAQVGNALSPTTVNPFTFEELDIDDNTGEVSLREVSGEDPADYISRYSSTLTGLLGLPGAMYETGLRGENIVRDFQNTAEVQGAVADTYVSATEEIAASTSAGGNNTTVKDISGRISVPAHAKVAATEQALNTLGTTEQNLAYAPSVAESVPGNIELVDRGVSATAEQNNGSVQGAINPVEAYNTSSAGQVAGRIIDFSDAEHHAPRAVEYAPGINPANFHHEQGAAHLLRAIGYNIGAGCGCQAATVFNEYGQSIIATINAY